jgi:hypothetical protein
LPRRGAPAQHRAASTQRAKGLGQGPEGLQQKIASLHAGRRLGEPAPADARPRRRAQDPFGNYVVQYVLELGHVEAMAAIMRQLCGHYADLAQQKFSSNVVEKCLKLGGPGLAELRERVIRELLTSPLLHRLLQARRPAAPAQAVRAAVSRTGGPRSPGRGAGSRDMFTGWGRLRRCRRLSRLRLAQQTVRKHSATRMIACQRVRGEEHLENDPHTQLVA